MTRHRAPRDCDRKIIETRKKEDTAYGTWECQHGLPLIIVEGEIDVLSIFEAGHQSISPPYGAASIGSLLENNDKVWQYVSSFDRVIIWGDNDSTGEKFKNKILGKLEAWRCYVVEVPEKDPNETLQKKGPEGVRSAIENAEGIPLAGSVLLSEIEYCGPSEWDATESTIDRINQDVGGYKMGGLVVWTGLPGHGKSTLVGQRCFMRSKRAINHLFTAGS